MISVEPNDLRRPRRVRRGFVMRSRGLCRCRAAIHEEALAFALAAAGSLIFGLAAGPAPPWRGSVAPPGSRSLPPSAAPPARAKWPPRPAARRGRIAGSLACHRPYEQEIGSLVRRGAAASR